MGVDSRIALSGQPLQLRDPLEQYGNALAVQNAQQTNALRAMQMQQAQDERAYTQQRRAGLNALLSSGQQDDALESALLKGGYLDESLKLGKDRRENLKTDAERKKAEADTAGKNLDRLIKQGEQFVQGMRTATPETWGQFRESQAMMFGPDAAARIPPQFDPVWVQTGLQRTVSEVERLRILQAQQSDATTRRGQDIQAATTRRGQDMTDAREREIPRGVPLETATGPVLVNPRTGAATPITGADGRPVPPKQPEFAKKETAGINAQINAIDAAVRAVDETPDAFGFTRGLATMAGTIPESLAQKASNDAQVKARSFVYNNVSKIINERAGAAQSAQELARLRSFLPAETDDARVIKAKLEGFKEYLAEQGKAYAPTAPSSAPRAKPAGSPSVEDLVKKWGG